MGPEGKDINKKRPEPPPEGVPGERSTVFAQLDDQLHANLQGRYGTDDPERLNLLEGEEREDFKKRFGSPQYIIARSSDSDTVRREVAWRRADKIKEMAQIRALQHEYNQTLARMRDLAVAQTRIDSELLELDGISWLNFIEKDKRTRLNTEAAKVRSMIAQTSLHQARQKELLAQFKINVPDGNQPYSETTFERT